MSRELRGHQVNPANDTITINVVDEAGSGGANHAYVVGPIAWDKNPSLPGTLGYDETVILFQNGPIAEAGVNGLTHEVLLAILIDRLEAFQSGPFANSYNADALSALHIAQSALLNRTRERMSRGVEGTHTI